MRPSNSATRSLGRLAGGRAQARLRQVALELLELRARLIALLLGGLQLRGRAARCRCLLAQPGELLACDGELVGGRARSGLAMLGHGLEIRDARRRLGRRRHLRTRLLEACALGRQLGGQLVAGAAQRLQLRRELLAPGRGIVQRSELLARLRERLAQLALAVVALRIGGLGAFVSGEVGLERGHAGLQFARPGPCLLALGPRGSQLGAQRRELLVGVGRPAGRGQLAAEALDLLLQLALPQIGELTIDDVLEPRTQLEQLDLVDRDLALELAQLRGVGGGCRARRPRRPRPPVPCAAISSSSRSRSESADCRRSISTAEVVHERRVLEHGLGHLAAVALALDVARQLFDPPFLAIDGVAQLHRRGGLLRKPFAAVCVLEAGDGALAFLQHFHALVELQLQLHEDALALLLDALLHRVFLDAPQRSAQASPRAWLRGLVEAVLEVEVVILVCDGAFLALLSTDVCGA